MMQFQSWLDALRQRVRNTASRRPSSVNPRNIPVEVVEQRTLLSVSALMVGGELSIISDGADSIEVRANPVAPTQLQVIANGTTATTERSESGCRAVDQHSRRQWSQPD